MIRLVCLAIGYGFGLFQTSWLISKKHGFDIRDYGSGNAGTTNMIRTLGLKYGLLTFLGDFLKSVIAILIVAAIFRGSCADSLPLLKMYAGAGVVLGHDFPFYLSFRGGKGVATTAGLMLAFDPVIFMLAFFAFFGVFLSTHYVSAASLFTYAMMFVEIALLGLCGHYHMMHPLLLELDLVTLCLTALCWWKHRANIARLLNGTERKTYLRKKKPE